MTKTNESTSEKRAPWEPPNAEIPDPAGVTRGAWSAENPDSPTEEERRELVGALAINRDLLAHLEEKATYPVLPYILQAICLELAATSMKLMELEEFKADVLDPVLALVGGMCPATALAGREVSVSKDDDGGITREDITAAMRAMGARQAERIDNAEDNVDALWSQIRRIRAGLQGAGAMLLSTIPSSQDVFTEPDDEDESSEEQP